MNTATKTGELRLAGPREQLAVPGIIGGLGPLAHVVFERRILAESARRGADGDACHPVWVLVSATDVPDRTLSIAGRAKSCTAALVRHGRRLHAAGADFVIVACNTAHAFHSEVQDQLPLPWINLIDLTVKSLALTYPRASKVGVLATNGTLCAGLYQRGLSRVGLTPISPILGSDLQQRIMDTVYAPGWGVKSTGLSVSERARMTLLAAIEELAARGAKLVVAGCTELSVVLEALGPERQPVLPCVDPLNLAAKLAVDLCFDSRALQTWLSRPRPLLPSETNAS